MLTGGNLYSVSSRSLLADVQLLRLLHLEHGRRVSCSRSSSASHGTAPSRWNPITSSTISATTSTSGSTVVSISSGTATSSGSTRSGTSRWNVAGSVRTAVVGHSSRG